jgi:hypothetical protein
MSAQAPTSPFKFLDAYGPQDGAQFFGRDDEIETLYRLLTESRLVMVYGQSGTGKTSLVQCGLTHKFSPTNWLPLTVRRGNDIRTSLDQALKTAAITPLKEGASTVEAVRSVYLDHLRPVFLIFDQFEELYVFGTKAEQEEFYATVKTVLEADVSCRMIVLLREDYLAALDLFERAVPTLFDKRLRVEVMTHANVEKVIVGTCAADGIVLEHGADTARAIIAQLDDKGVGVQLAYLQVYLDHLYRGAAAGGSPATFTDAAIAETGKLGNILAGFLDEQQKAIEAQLAGQVHSGTIARMLEEFVSVDGTKQPSTYDEVLERMPGAAPWLQSALDLLQHSRLLRRVDDHYELAHDELAKIISSRRSPEREQVLVVERIVRNRFTDFAQTKSLLNAEELGLVKSAGKVLDPLDGKALLKLDDDAAQFVRKSSRSLWRRRIGAGAALALVTTAVLVGLALFREQQRNNQEQARRAELEQKLAKFDKANASNIADVVGFGVYLRANVDERKNKDGVVRWAHETVKGSNNYRDFAPRNVSDAEMAQGFWSRLYDADVAYGTGSKETALGAFRSLEQEQGSAHDAHPEDVIALVKLKAVLWHHYFWNSWPDPVVGEKLFVVLEAEVKGAGNDPLNFESDLIDVCSQPSTPKLLIERCKLYRIKERGAAVEAPAEEPQEGSLEPPRVDYNGKPSRP